MAPYAAGSRSRFGIQQNRASSPNDNAYATATSNFSENNLMHSTPQRQEGTQSEQGLPLHYGQLDEQYREDTEGSADMSIELGRGTKRGAQQEREDISSDAAFGFGEDGSQYEITGTPPVRPKTAQRKTDGILRKEASLRQANQSAKANDALKRSISGSKQRAVSDNSPRLHTEPEEPFQPTATFTVRGSRFSSGRQTSAAYAGLPTRFTAAGILENGDHTPHRPTTNSATVQSATYTANQSFMLPDMPNITELVSGVRADGTPVPKRAARFTSAPLRRQGQTHRPIDAVPIPDDERAIFASLTLLRDRVTQLEVENSEKEKREEEYEREISNLRSQLEIASRRSDSALGSDEDTDRRQRQDEQTGLRVKVKTLQDRLDRTERKVNISEIAFTRVTRERDALITQIGDAYYNNESLAKENEALYEAKDGLQTENDDLKLEITDLRHELSALRKRVLRERPNEVQDSHHDQRRTSISMQKQKCRGTSRQRELEDDMFKFEHNSGKAEADARKTTKTRSRSHSREQSRHRSSTRLDQDFSDDVDARIERVLQDLRSKASTDAQNTQQTRDRGKSSSSLRARSRSQQRDRASGKEHFALRRHVSAPAEIDNQTESTTELDAARKSQRASYSRHGDTRSTTKRYDDEDLTVLSDIDTNAVADLRRKLEQERREKRLNRQSSVIAKEENCTTRSDTHHSIQRKSSMKNLAGAPEDGTGRFSMHGGLQDDHVRAAKTVRVQSPHSSQDMPQQNEGEDEAVDESILSNTSRRRKRSAGSEGMTSAFIIPDITMHNNQSLPVNLGKSCIHHNAASCSICVSDGESVDIPVPVPVTDRSENDLTNATIRPAQDPEDALATVIKNLEDEITHLKMQRERQNQEYNQHDPALGKRKRQAVKDSIDKLTAQIEKRSDQVYRLYDVLEGQKDMAAKGQGNAARAQEVEDTLTSLGIDPVELSGRVGRKAPAGLADIESGSDSEELPWEGLSDVESDLEGH